VNVLRIYATNATGFAGLDLQDCFVSFTDGWWINWYRRIHRGQGLENWSSRTRTFLEDNNTVLVTEGLSAVVQHCFCDIVQVIR